VLIPCIDIMDGKIVQLVQGEKKALEFTSFEPWIERFSGYPLVQVIDLDAAMQKGHNRPAIEKLLKRLPCQVGGGIRSLDAARTAIEAGARSVILGSALVRNDQPDVDFAEALFSKLGPERLVRETIALVTADPSRVDGALFEAHVQLTRERGNLGRQNSRAFMQATRSLGLRMADPRFWTRMRRVEAATLVVHGELDRLIPLAAARELVRRRTDWTLAVIEGAGHVPMMETPDRFVEVVNQWLAYKIGHEPATVS